jgi:hypothetical protein
MEEQLYKEIRSTLELCWSEDTVGFPCPEGATISYCQCGVTAIVINEIFGGKILKTHIGKVDGGSIVHFYNKINGKLVDFTADQFDSPENYWCELKYEDHPSSLNEALSTVQPEHIKAMRERFKEAYSKMASKE